MTHQDHLDYLAGVQQHRQAQIAGCIDLRTPDGQILMQSAVGAHFDSAEKISLRQRQFAYHKQDIIFRSAMAEYQRRLSLPISAPEHRLSAQQRKEIRVQEIAAQLHAHEIDEHEHKEVMRQAELSYQLDLMVAKIKANNSAVALGEITNLMESGFAFKEGAWPRLIAPLSSLLYDRYLGNRASETDLHVPQLLVAYENGATIGYSSEIGRHLINQNPEMTYERYRIWQAIDARFNLCQKVMFDAHQHSSSAPKF